MNDFFQKNRDKYLIPGKYKFNVVRFNFIKYEQQAEKLVTDKIVDTYYESNKAEFKGKNEETAKKEIKESKIKEKIAKLAKTDAQKFAVNTFKNIEKKQKKSRK